jgi:hypothetical protein
MLNSYVKNKRWFFLYILSFLLIYLNIKQLYKYVWLFKIFYYFILYDYILRYYYKNIIGSGINFYV